MGTGSSKKKKRSKSRDYVDLSRDITPSSGCSSPDKMAIFRKQSPESKKKLQHQLYLARETPEPIFDISGCELSEIPSGVFSLCKVFQKEALLAHTNWLGGLKGGGLFSDLSNIRVLDLHDNELTSLPDDLSKLTSLQVFNLSNNRLKSLSDDIGCLISLQTLNLKGNRLKNIPDTVRAMRSLRTLDISDNGIHYLPTSLCRVRTLESLQLDASDMIYPPSNICLAGTEAIMKFICSDVGVEYIPPSKALLSVLDAPKFTSTDEDTRLRMLQADFTDLSATVMQYEQLKEKKRQQHMMLEEQLAEDQLLQTNLAAKSAADKQHLVDSMAEAEERIHEDLSQLHNRKDVERRRLFQTLQDADENASRLLAELLAMNEKARRTEELLDQMERERMETEEWFTVRQEEAENIRKKEVLINMEKILEESTLFDSMIRGYLNSRDYVVQRAQEAAMDNDDQLESVLASKQMNQQMLIQKLLKEEKLQIEAFEVLQMQKDARHSRLRGQIELIEKELSQLTALELEQAALKLDTSMNTLQDRRGSLTRLLIQLLDEKDKREVELRKRLAEMDEQKEDSQKDFWLVQYQRLMDRKPQALIDQETNMEFAVLEIVKHAGAAEYIPVFARHRISIETLCQMTDSDFKQIGIHELGLRKNLEREINRYRLRADEERAAAKLKKLEEPESEWLVKPPSPGGRHVRENPDAPSRENDVGEQASAPPCEVTARGLNSECVVCMDSTSSVLFLRCGHVCCCEKCAASMKECPMCRSPIVQMIRLT